MVRSIGRKITALLLGSALVLSIGVGVDGASTTFVASIEVNVGPPFSSVYDHLSKTIPAIDYTDNNNPILSGKIELSETTGAVAPTEV